MALLVLLACQGAPSDSDAPPVAADCGTDEPAWGLGGDDMLPGTDCLACHAAGGRASSTPFSLGGTVFAAEDCYDGVAGAVVTVVDADGAELTLTTSALGNFWTTEALAPPLRVSVTTARGTLDMASDAWTGACGACHTLDEAGLVFAAP